MRASYVEWWNTQRDNLRRNLTKTFRADFSRHFRIFNINPSDQRYDEGDEGNAHA